MPAQLSTDDAEADVTPPNGYLQPLPVTLGPSRVQNDVRVVVAAAAADSGVGPDDIAMNPDPVTGFTSIYSPAPGSATEGIYIRRLLNGDSDTSVSWTKPPGWRYFFWSLFTVRGVDPLTAPTGGRLTIHRTTGDAFFTIDSVTVPGPGLMVFFIGSTTDLDNQWPSFAAAIGKPAGGAWKSIAATDKSGDTFDSYNTDPACAVLGKSFSAAGSTGTVTVPIAIGAPAFIALWAFFPAAPDYTSTGSAMTATDSMSTGTSSTSTNPVSQGSPMVATDSMSTGFNPLLGYTIIPYRLRGNPVEASRVQWDVVLPPGSSATFESSLNGGLSWDECSNWAPIPRLLPGDTTTRTVLFRVTMSRASSGGGTPRLRSLKVRVGCARSYDELIRTFYGPVDKTKVKITAGSSGGTGGSSGGPGTTVRGGGSFGGGPVMTLHATDPSRLIKLAGWPQPYVGPTDVTIDQLLRAMVLDRRPNQKLFNQVSTEHGLDDSLTVWGLQDAGDPWQDIRAVATGAGQEAFYGVNDDFCSRPVPDPRYGPIAFEFDHTSRAAIIGEESELDTALVVNGYVIQGESTTSKNPVSAFAYNTDVSSKYNIFPPPIGIGMRIKRLKFPLAQTTQQCQDIANGLLFNSLGLANTVTLRIVKHPGIALGDVLRINNPETGAIGRFLAQGYEFPDGLEDMELTCFRQTDSAA